MPVVGYNAYPAIAGNGPLYTGVGKLERSDNYSGSAVLLADGHHVLTAAHMVDRYGHGTVDNITFTLTFMVYRATGSTFTAKVNPADVTEAPGSKIIGGKPVGGDLAILTL